MALVFGLVAAAWCLRNAGRGLYLFDDGIVTHYGWLIRNGWRPLVDIVTPLQPMPGWLAALAFRIWGVRLMATGYLAALLSFAAAALAFRMVSRRLRPWETCVLLLPWIAAASPLTGTLFYNPLIVLFEGVVVAYFVAATGEPTAPARSARAASAEALGAGLAMGGIVTTKWQEGALIGVAVLSAGLAHRLLSRDARWLPPRHPWIFAGGVLAPMLGEIVAIRGDLSAWVRTNPMAALAPRSLLARLPGAQLDGLIQSPGSVFGRPEVTVQWVVVLGLASLALRSGWRVPGAGRARAAALVLLAVVRWQGITVTSLVSGEAHALEVARIGLFLVLFAAAASSLHSPRPAASRVPATVAIVAVGLAGFAIRFAESGARKSWNESAGNWRALPVGNVAHSAVPFFADVAMTPDQALRLDALRRLLAANPSLRVYFGPENEMLYAATGRLPPKPWILWSHPGVSVQPAQYAELSSRLAASGVDVLVMSGQRWYLADYVRPVTRGFPFVTRLPGFEILSRRPLVQP